MNKTAFEFQEFLETNPCGSAASKYRQMVLDVVRPCLESSSSRLVSLGVSCLQRVVRDDRFHSRQINKSRSTTFEIDKALSATFESDEKKTTVETDEKKATVETDEKKTRVESSVDEESWMTVQVLAAVHPINTLTDEHQQEILKVCQYSLQRSTIY
jgi:hypothetical protein